MENWDAAMALSIPCMEPMEQAVSGHRTSFVINTVW